uniref:Essential MCU regulator, mitochondrial n=1 Tax=Monodelphis domestica TaxID=13616 RepID=F6PLZ3_MONDO
MWRATTRCLAATPAQSWALLGPGIGRRKTQSGPEQDRVPSRHHISKRSGAIRPRPTQMPFGLLRVFFVVFTFSCFGTLISQHIASLLKYFNVFDPEDDDDDDW